jgi:hypothetical protein
MPAFRRRFDFSLFTSILDAKINPLLRKLSHIVKTTPYRESWDFFTSFYVPALCGIVVISAVNDL